MRPWLILFIFFLTVLCVSAETSDDHNNLPTGNLEEGTILGLKVFRDHYREYKPDQQALEAIRNDSRPVHIKVIFGDWCSDSKEHVPEFMKTMDLAANGNIKVTYVNVHRKREDRGDLVAGLDIKAIPTFIVYSDSGKEMGRIVESPQASVEADLAGILAGNGEKARGD